MKLYFSSLPFPGDPQGTHVVFVAVVFGQQVGAVAWGDLQHYPGLFGHPVAHHVGVTPFFGGHQGGQTLVAGCGGMEDEEVGRGGGVQTVPTSECDGNPVVV